jgi:hypothetical protein
MIRSKKIKWLIADVSMCWALELAVTAGVRVALFSTFSAAVFLLRLHIPKLIEDGIIDVCGKRNISQSNLCTCGGHVVIKF